MFGLMRHAGRLPYCGTCKTLGAVYGQRTRALLNHDTVFLAELLMGFAGEPEWSSAYRSFNCLTLPRRQDSIPIALEYCATATIVLAHFHILDHWADTKKTRWRFAARVFSPAYHKAMARLRSWKFPIDELTAVLATRRAREASPESLAHVAEPTAVATALFFSQGARVTGCADRADAMYRVGHRFGFLAYLLDAYEDRARDEKRGDFNPLLVFPEIKARAEILAAAADIERELSPGLAARLRANVEERLGLRLRILHRCTRKPFRNRWRSAVAFARSMREREKCGFVRGLAVVSSVAVLAFLFPHHARAAESWRQCLGVGMT